MRKVGNIFLGLCVFFSSGIFSQQPNENYTEIISRVNKLYEQGNFSEAISLATSVSFKNATITDRWKQQRLLALTYLADNKPELAKKAAEDMLQLNPTYRPSYVNDPTELIKLLKEITVIPKFAFGLALSIGTNSTFPEIKKQYILADYQKKYSSKNSFQFGFSTAYNINSSISLDLGVLATQKSFSTDYSLTNWKVNIGEKLTYIDIPLMFKYSFFPKKKFHIHLQGGGYAGYLLFSKNDFSSLYIPENEQHTLNNLNSQTRRNRYNYGWVGGVGLGYKMGQGQMFFNANYFRSFSNITNGAERYKYSDLTYTYYYADDDMILHNLVMNLGYSYYMNYKIIRKK